MPEFINDCDKSFLSSVFQLFGNKVFGPFAVLIPVFVALSCFGGVNGVIFTSARLFATGAQDGNLPSFFSLVHHKQQTPIPSLIFSVKFPVLMASFTHLN